MKELVEKKLDEYREWMIEARRHIHMHPETGDQEYETTAYIEKLLGEMGIKTERLLDTGLVGLLEAPEGAGGGKCIGVRADIDALPIEEETDLPFKSVNPGVMHACGHDMHAAALLATARILSSPEIRANMTAPVKFFFQPAEETTGGAARMIEKGCLESPRVEHVIAYHVAPELYAGTVGTRHGYTHASSVTFRIRVHGVKSHGAFPSEGVDAIVAASQIVTAIQSIVARNVNSLDPCVITIGEFHAGTAGNIVCDLAELTGTMRTTTDEAKQVAIKRLEEVTRGVASAMGASAEVEIIPSYIALHNDDHVADIIDDISAQVAGRENVIAVKYPSMGVEDFAFFAAARPSAFFFVGTGYQGRENHGIHHGKFEADESALDVAVMIEVLSVLRLMKE